MNSYIWLSISRSVVYFAESSEKKKKNYFYLLPGNRRSQFSVWNVLASERIRSYLSIHSIVPQSCIYFSSWFHLVSFWCVGPKVFFVFIFPFRSSGPFLRIVHSLQPVKSK